MTGAALALLGAAVVLAAIDWWAVHAGRNRLEYFAKPATMVLLVGAALAVDPADEAQRRWFVVALCLSLLGDVFLMLPRDRFVAGLASFLLAHLAYIVGLVLRGLEPPALVVGAGLAALAVAVLGRRILSAAPAGLEAAVGAYIVVISVMVALAIGTGEPWLIVGACLFYASDALIGWTRFVGPVPHGRVAVMASYHLGQIGLVLGLL